MTAWVLLGRKGPPEHCTTKQSSFGLVQFRNRVLFDGGKLKFEVDGVDSCTTTSEVESTKVSSFWFSVSAMDRFDTDRGLLLIKSLNSPPSSSPSDKTGWLVGISAEGFQYLNPITGVHVICAEACNWQNWAEYHLQVGFENVTPFFLCTCPENSILFAI